MIDKIRTQLQARYDHTVVKELLNNRLEGNALSTIEVVVNSRQP
jgi:hypothetical protein